MKIALSYGAIQYPSPKRDKEVSYTAEIAVLSGRGNSSLVGFADVERVFVPTAMPICTAS